MTSSLNIGLRYAFPVYPALFITSAVLIARTMKRWRRPTIVAAGVLGVALSYETLSAWPDYIAFFNIACGQPQDRLQLLADSNLDWGQDLPALAAWQKEHPDAKLSMAYFGTVEPAFYGIQSDPLPPWPPSQDLLTSRVIVISATLLQGVYAEGYYTGYQRLPPTRILGGTLYVYDLRRPR